jgi:hypothetical protein
MGLNLPIWQKNHCTQKKEKRKKKKNKKTGQFLNI